MMSDREQSRKCWFCGKPLAGYHRQAKTCSDRCRQVMSRVKRRAKLAADQWETAQAALGYVRRGNPQS